MRHFASRDFWEAYDRLPQKTRSLADKNYALLKENPRHPSLQFKKVGRSVSALIIVRWPSRHMTDWSGSGSVHTPNI
jgi:hypothetical protein